MGAIAAAVAGGIAAGATSAGVSAATAPDAPDFRISGRDIGADPLVGLLTGGAFSRAGLTDLSSLGQASPLNQAFQAFRTQGFKNKALLGNLPVFQQAIARITSGQTTLEQEMDVTNPPSGNPNNAKLFRKNIGFLAGLVNMSPEQFIQAQAGFIDQIKPLVARSLQSSQLAISARGAALDKLSRLSENFPSFDAQRLSELVALENASLDDQQRDILRTANVGNFNPGRALSTFERDRPLIALERALSLAGGEISLADQSARGLLNILTPQQDIDLAAIRAGVAPATGAVDPNPPDNTIRDAGEGLNTASNVAFAGALGLLGGGSNSAIPASTINNAVLSAGFGGIV